MQVVKNIRPRQSITNHLHGKLESHISILIILLLPSFSFGQKYKFEYREHLICQQSTFTLQTADTLFGADSCTLSFNLKDKRNEIVPFATIKMKGNSIDTIIRSDRDGLVNITLPVGIFSISISASAFQFVPLQLDDFDLRTNTTINASLGLTNYLRIALIHSRRKLTDEEIRTIVNDLSNDKYDTELIKNGTCYVSWEI